MDITLKALYGTDDGAAILKGKCTEKQVRAFASAKSGTPVQMTADECRKLCKAAGIEYMDGYEGRVLRYRITDETVDRYGDIIRAKGVRLDNYKKNPVVQFAHNYEEPPIGASLSTWYDKETNSVWADPLFIDDRVDTSGRSELVFRLARANIMRACSIGFVPIDVYNPGDTEEREALGLGQWGVEFRKSDLMEFSPVAVPANPNALKDEYREAFARSVRSAGFGKRHLDTLRKYPILADNAIDALIRELDDRRAAIISSGIEVKGEAVLRPYPNEHAARLREPDGFDDFRRKADGAISGGSVEVPNTADVLWGHVKGGGEDEWAEQSIRFPVKDWTEESAKKWLKDNAIDYIMFEAASEKSADEQTTPANTTKDAPAGTTALNTRPDDADARATQVSVSLSCDDLIKSITQLQSTLSEAKTTFADMILDMRTMVSTVRGALADNQERKPKQPAVNINLYDEIFKKH